MARTLAAPAFTALSLLLVVACDESSDPMVSPDASQAPADAEVPDNGVLPADMGFADTGARDTGDVGFDCSTNPNGCVERQRLDAECRCLPECNDGFRWNPVTMACDPPPAGECAIDSDCAGSDSVCLNPAMGTQPFAPCAGEASCQCFTGCNPFVGETRTGCPAGQACAHLLTSGLSADAICVPPGTGRTQGLECNLSLLSCNRNTNHFCIGASMTSTVPGQCQRLCDTAEDDFCAEQGPGLACNPASIQDFPALGLCGNPPLPINDFGRGCATDDMCAGICSQILSGCSASCRPPNACPTGSECINFTGAPPGESSICMVSCASPDAAGDAECQARNGTWVCRNLVTNLAPLCSPPCTVLGCAPPQMCNVQTGRCE
ncbi:MAG: hypothetical protein AAFZ18_04550 [Myxococcota bacterium]